MAEMASYPGNPDAAFLVANPEVTTKAKRRRFSAQYKLQILREADANRSDRPPIGVSVIRACGNGFAVSQSFMAYDSQNVF